MAKARTQLQSTPASAPAKVLDISTRRMAESVEVAITDPLDATVDTGMRVVVRSPNSSTMRAASAAWYAEHAPEGKIEKGQWTSFMLEMAIAGTVSWNGIVDGVIPVASTPENIRALYEHPETAWIGEQVAAAYTDKSRFFGKPRISL